MQCNPSLNSAVYYVSIFQHEQFFCMVITCNVVCSLGSFLRSKDINLIFLFSTFILSMSLCERISFHALILRVTNIYRRCYRMVCPNSEQPITRRNCYFESTCRHYSIAGYNAIDIGPSWLHGWFSYCQWSKIQDWKYISLYFRALHCYVTAGKVHNGCP